LINLVGNMKQEWAEKAARVDNVLYD